LGKAVIPTTSRQKTEEKDAADDDGWGSARKESLLGQEYHG
jgi:hypothetical protein